MIKDNRKNSEGIGPEFTPGMRVYHAPSRKQATVVQQQLHYGGLGTEFWGDVIIEFDNDTVETTAHNWQLSRVQT
jgi:hypothetical protein